MRPGASRRCVSVNWRLSSGRRQGRLRAQFNAARVEYLAAIGMAETGRREMAAGFLDGSAANDEMKAAANGMPKKIDMRTTTTEIARRLSKPPLVFAKGYRARGAF